MNELLTLLESRRDMYSVLARLYQAEVTPQLLADLKSLHFPEATESTEFNEASRRMNAFVAELSEAGLDELAADYARTFLAAGIADGPAAFPIESVYTSREHLIMQDAFEAVLQCLRSHGWATAAKDLYADHIGVELEFMSRLSAAAADAVRQDRTEEAEKALEESKEFLKTHLLNWTDKFFSDVKSVAGTDFYKSLAALTRLYLAEDRAWLAD